MSKQTKYAELQKLTREELHEQLRQSKDDLFKLRFQLAMRQLQNTARLGQVRRRIAQVHTALRELELAKQGGKHGG
jgi:large subunit ribosomal protein L29